MQFWKLFFFSNTFLARKVLFRLTAKGLRRTGTFEPRLLFSFDKLNLSFNLVDISSRSSSHCFCSFVVGRNLTILRVAMGKWYRLLGCFLGNLEIGYSGTSIGRSPSDFKLPSSTRIGNIFVGARVRITGPGPLVENSKRAHPVSNARVVRGCLRFRDRWPRDLKLLPGNLFDIKRAKWRKQKKEAIYRRRRRVNVIKN